MKGARRKKARPVPAATRNSEHALSIEVQQIILNQFSAAYSFANAADLKQTIQAVKGYLYDRDFAQAFGQPAHLEAYALRWSAARALGYADLLTGLDLTFSSDEQRKVVCIGGGAGAEVAALTATLGQTSRLFITAIDIADWSTAVSKLQVALSSPPPLSTCASTAARAANQPLIACAHLDVQFVHQDVLAGGNDSLRERLQQIDLVTIMFTLNELFTSSIAKTTRMLLDLTETMPVDSHLLVVDSPGSYSEIVLGKPEAGEEAKTKKYPMKWLLDHTLQDVAKGKWEKALGDDSRWFRVPQVLKYPIELENMRYQVHLYKRISS